MRTAIDTNVLSGLWSVEPLAERIAMELAEAHSQGGLVVCAPVFAELLAHPKATQDFVEDFLAETGIVVDFNLEESVWRQAAKSFAAYAQRRRRSAGDAPKRLLVDFIIASHALFHADRLMTLDAKRYSQDFPKLRIV
jgi:predicted nucleic acid-binding protein